MATNKKFVAKNGLLAPDAEFTGVASVVLPSGTTAERPQNPVAGMIRFNIDLDAFEGYDGDQWVPFDEADTGSSVAVATTDITTVDSFDKNTVRATKYVVNVDQGSDHRTSEILVSSDDDSDSFLTEYAIISSDTGIAAFSTDISGDDVRLRVTMNSGDAATVRFTKISLLK